MQKDAEEDAIYCSIHLVRRGVWRRLAWAARYVVGYRCRYGPWDEFILRESELQRIANDLKTATVE